MTVKGSKNRLGSLPLTFPKVQAQNAVSSYVQSKIYEKQIQYTRRWEISRDCSSVQLINAKVNLRNIEKCLASSRKIAKHRRKEFDEKWEELATQQETFKTMFKKFNCFIRENQEKRDRAERKITDEINLQYQRSYDIEAMQEDYTRIANVKNLMEKKIKDHKMYEDYLQAVEKTSSAYKNINELLFRYESLIETKTFLSEKQQLNLNALEYAQSNMMKLVEEKALALVGLQNQLASLQERYDLAYAKSLQWESTVSKIQDICSFEMSNKLNVKRSIDHTYAAMCGRKNMDPNLVMTDCKSKLILIKKTLAVLATILIKSKSQCRLN